MARNGEGGAVEAGESSGSDESGEVVLLVCIKCGEEARFEGAQEPSQLECEKCGNQVFRRFEDDEDDESRVDFRESTDRDTQTDAGGGEVSRQDLMDLNNP